MQKIASFIVLLLVVLVAGCEQTIPTAALALSNSSLEERELQSRYYETSDEEKILSAVAAVLQDLGFNLDQSETRLGFILGSKDRDARDTEQIAGVFFMALLGANVPFDTKQKMRAAVIVAPSSNGKRMRVRVTFQRKVWNSANQISKVETLKDPEFYQEFFARLSKSIFLEALNI